MKKILIVLSGLLLIACNANIKEVKKLEARIDSLERNPSSYKPGFGEFMSNIQIHHAKLWFAGQNQNWPLADFEIHEIMETVDALKKYQTERPETGSLTMIDDPLNEVNAAIQKKDPVAFKNNFVMLTNTCNTCHKSVNFSFNVVKIPESPPFSNQDFKSKY